MNDVSPPDPANAACGFRAEASPIHALAMAWRQPPPAGCRYDQRGQTYLQDISRLTPSPGLIARAGEVSYLWIGREIHHLNQALSQLLDQCQACLAPSHRPLVEIFAAPLVLSAGIKGFCHVMLTPAPLFIDIGQVHPQDWLAIVAHEYAHAIAATQGHGLPFQAALTHLCLGLGLIPPPLQIQDPTLWQTWPPCRQPNHTPGFWAG